MSEMRRGQDVSPPSSDDRVHAILRSISEVMMQGSPVSPVQGLDAGDEQTCRQIIADLTALQNFSRSLAAGSLSEDLRVTGYLAGYLKTIQADLLHLTWQAKMIAAGDLSQRVDFMGEFSDSFNFMVESLQVVRVEAAAREQDLSMTNEHLANEVRVRGRAEEALNQVNRKLTLLSSITRHDINNQLTVLLGYLEILEDGELDPSQNEYFQKVTNAAERISAMIRFTKEYEEIGAQAPAWQDCRTIVDTAAQEALLGKVMVKNDLPAGTEMFADPLIIKVCYNLMDNAVRYGGRITTIRFYVQESGDDHLIICEDDGVGVVAEEKERIFERGFGKNTGLGLAISREILSITGITICEAGEPGKGARFEMTVPKGMYR